MTSRESTYALRPVRRSDAAAVLAAFGSAPDMGRQGPVVDEEAAGEYVGWLLAEGRRAFAVVGDDDQLVGLVGVTVDAPNRNGWVFYWMHAAHRGRGLVSRALTTVADQMLRTDLERLELGHRVDNPASGAVARAAGFVLEGRERGKFLIDGSRLDVLTYGRLREDPWPAVEPLRLRPER